MKHSDNNNSAPRKVPFWTLGIVILAVLLSGSSLVVGLRTQSGMHALQQQLLSYEQQLSAVAQAEAASPSLAPTPEVTPTPEATPEPAEQPAVQQAVPTKQPATKTPPPVQKQEITVYVTKTGECYHSGECYHLKQSKISISLDAAKEQGYRRCSHCNAPQ